MYIFRVVKTTIDKSSSQAGLGPQCVETEVIWEGFSVTELSEVFPHDLDDPQGAPIGQWKSEDGLLVVRHAIQQIATIGGSWLNINDPRPLPV